MPALAKHFSQTFSKKVLLIKGGRVIDPANSRNGIMDVLVERGKIARVGTGIAAKGAKKIDARGLIVAPGLIDMHVHLREPGREDKETIQTCTRAAARGGFTTIVGMPNTNPTADNQTVIEFVLSKAAREGIVNVYPVGAITKKIEGYQLAEMGELKKTGAVAVSDDGHCVQNAEVMRRAMEYSTMWKMPIISHSEDTDLAGKGAMHEGLVSTRLALQGKPAAAEDVIVAREIVLAEMTCARVHFTHVSTKGSVEMIRQAKKRRVPVTADTCPHYFTLTDEAALGYNALAKVNPPLRSKEHVDAVRNGLKDGTIDCIASDHAPHLLLDKFQEFEECENGIVGLETEVPLVITKLVNEKVLTIQQAIEKLTINPAKVLNFPNGKGTLSIGADADITLIDLNRSETIDANEFESKGRNTPFNGMKVKGIPVMTIVAGKIVMRDRKVIV